MDRRERVPPKSCTGGPKDGPSGKVPAQKLHRWSNGWTVGKGFRPKAAPVVQRMDHRERFPSKSCTGGPTDGPSGKVSVQKLHRWSNGWTVGKGFRPKAAPVVQRMDRRERIQPKSCTGGPTDGPSGKGSPSQRNGRVGPMEDRRPAIKKAHPEGCARYVNRLELLCYARMPLACRKALMAVATKRKTMRLAAMVPMTFTLLNQVLPFQPMVWNMLQKPWLRCSQMEANQIR